MFLSSIIIKNFRAIKEANVTFNKGLNVIIGRNNTGKTAVIDALRICFSYGKQWRDIYINKEEDFYIDESTPEADLLPIEFHLIFRLEKPEEAGTYYELLAQNKDGTQEIQLHFRYYLDAKEKIKWAVWGGDNEGQQISPDVMSLIAFIYLNPLRDAVACLKPIRWNQIGELFAGLVKDSKGNLLDDKKREELANRIANTVSNDKEWKRLIEAGKNKINEHLKNSSIEEDRQAIELDFLPYEFRRIVDNIRIQLPLFDKSVIKGDQEKQKYFQLTQNGLGYNNLIYIATVLGDLINKRDVEPEAYYSLLIEEPEAHLHPQLQNLFFRYMNKLKDKGIQLFVTSHSPTITSKVDLDSLIVLQKKNKIVNHLALRNSELNEKNKKYLYKFLDTTKSQLFFANGVILVEGISEALLMPVFAEKSDCDLAKFGIEIVNIGGVAFEHFAKLFNNENKAKNLTARCAIITDDDKKDGKESSRAEKAKTLEKGNLKVSLADVTFEKELYEKNETLLKSIYSDMHSRTTIENYIDFLEKLKTNKDKSELAHILSVKLGEKGEAYNELTVPSYIVNAIKWVAEGKWDVQQPV